MMYARIFTLGILSLVSLTACTVADGQGISSNVCSQEWYTLVEQKVTTGDSDGHGPDIGSLEWRSVIEFKLGIRGAKGIPALESKQWCHYINESYIN